MLSCFMTERVTRGNALKVSGGKRGEPEKMTYQYLRDIILNFMIVIKDATAITLSWFFNMPCKNPLIQESIVELGSNRVELSRVQTY